MKFDNLEDWSKWLEKNFSLDIMIPTLPVICRFDGVGFSKFTKKLVKPFDERLTDLMVETTKMLVAETNAIIGYTQSDEITLILYSSDRNSAIYNDGKKQKILSKTTSKLVNFFNAKCKEYLPEQLKVADFDCRIYQTPTLNDACAQLLWRENDATRNSKQMLGRYYFSDKALFKLNTNLIQDKLMLEKSVNWNDLPVKFKRGSYVRRVKTSQPFTVEEIENLPKKHKARTNPNLVIERNRVSNVELPIFNKITNKVDVVFNGADPILYEKPITED